MSWLGQVLAASHPATPEKWLVDWFGGPTSATGLAVSVDTAKRLTAVTAALRIISETQAMIPLFVYRRLIRGKERFADHPLYRILHNQANPWQTAFEFKRMMTWHAAAGGVAYARIVTGADGTITGLVPMLPSRTRPLVLEDGRIAYEYRLQNGQIKVYLFEEVFKLLAFSEDGVTSKSLIDTCQEAVGVGLAAEEYAARYYRNSGTPAGVLIHPRTLSSEAKERLRSDWRRLYEGPENVGRTAILQEDMKYQAIGVSQKDAQFLESRKFQVTEIARMFRIPPHMLADLERATFTNIEHQGLEFVTYTMAMWLVLWEQSVWRDLLTETEQESLFAEHLVDSLLRGDTSSRYSAYAVGRQWGWLSANDIRERENMNPIPEGDDYLQPLNMVPAGADPEPAPVPPPTPTRSDAALQRGAMVGLLAEPWRRVARRTEERTAKAKSPAAMALALSGHGDYIVTTLTPVATNIALLLGLPPDRTEDMAPVLAVLASDYTEAVVRSGPQDDRVWGERAMVAIERQVTAGHLARGKAA